MLDLFLVSGPGKLNLDNLEFASRSRNPRDQVDRAGGTLFQMCVAELEKSVRLTTERRNMIAVEEERNATMQGDTVADAELFLQKWRRARYLLVKEGIAASMTSQEQAWKLQQAGIPDNDKAPRHRSG